MDAILPDTPAELAAHLLAELRSRANPVNVAGMARFGISADNALGVTVSDIRGLARDAKTTLRRDKPALHELAALLWTSDVHEALIMATVLEQPALVTREQAERWVLDVDSWDICDGLCGNVLWRTSFAWELPAAWAARPESYVKRAGFVVAAQLAVKDKAAPDSAFLPLLGLVAREATDDRNEVKKAANWALRQIGKRNATLNAPAIATAEKILAQHPKSSPARWIARDAVRELRGDAVRTRLGLAPLPSA